MNQETKNKLRGMREKVLSTIKADRVTMRSRFYFISRTTLWILGLVLIFGLALYLISFIVFIFKGNSLLLLPSLGTGGWLSLFMSLPWILLGIVFIVFILLQILSSHFSFAYKRPLVNTILISIFILILGSFAIGQTELHERASRFSQDREIPFAAPFYRDAIRDRGNVLIGVIEIFEKETFQLISRGGDTYTIRITDETRMPPFGIATSSTVMVMGVEDDGVIEAIGIRPFNINRSTFHNVTKKNKKRQ